MEGDAHNPVSCPQLRISIHALRMEGDFFFSDITVSPVGISIHALRMEGDIEDSNPGYHWD